MGKPTSGLTLKQQKFLKVYFETGNATKAALQAYDTTDSKVASDIGSQNLAKLGDVIKKIMERKGLDPEKMVDKVNEATNAEKWNDFTGEREPDHSIRLKAVEVAERWWGIKEPEQKTFNIDTKILVLPPELIKKYDVTSNTK